MITLRTGTRIGKVAPSGDVLYRFGKTVHDEELAAFGAFIRSKGRIECEGPWVGREQ